MTPDRDAKGGGMGCLTGLAGGVLTITWAALMVMGLCRALFETFGVLRPIGYLAALRITAWALGFVVLWMALSWKTRNA